MFLSGEELAYKPTHVAGRIRFFVAYGHMSKTSCWLLVEYCFKLNEATGSFLPYGPHLRPSIFMADCFFKAKKAELDVLARQELDPCIITLIFATFHWL